MSNILGFHNILNIVKIVKHNSSKRYNTVFPSQIVDSKLHVSPDHFALNAKLPGK
jgi:hypothetical protein